MGGGARHPCGACTVSTLPMPMLSKSGGIRVLDGGIRVLDGREVYDGGRHIVYLQLM